MNWLENVIDIKILIAFGVGVLSASLCLIPMLREHNQENAQQSKMKLSTKSIPSTQDLKQVYIKGNEKQQCQKNEIKNERKKNNQNSIKLDKNQQDFFLNQDKGIRKKIKQQNSDEESSSQINSSSQSFIDNDGFQNYIKSNNIKNQNENDQLPSSSRLQEGEQIQVDSEEYQEELKQDSLIPQESLKEQDEFNN
ncbi:unnamed protein product [Paramecium sonneborni]|uniref:Transmembrane protein n=1 Tax=Paramecium sonneborni TaxID=65129 RepID=A0A8S1N5V3_9CILI|nr:unnamed protein product [Paramecium sonneborni]